MNKRDAASDDERESGDEYEEGEFSDAESSDEEEAIAPRGAASGDEAEEEGKVEEVQGNEGAVDKEQEGEGGEETAAREPAPRVQRKKLQPFEVPTSGDFWLHDDRFDDSVVTEEDMRDREDVPLHPRKLWDPSTEEKWGHDRFEALERGEDIPDSEDTMAAFNRMDIRRGRGRGAGRGGRGRGGYVHANGATAQPVSATERLELGDDDAPPPGFEDAFEPRPARSSHDRGQQIGRRGRGGAFATQTGGRKPASQSQPIGDSSQHYDGQPVVPAARGRGRGGRGGNSGRGNYAPIPTTTAAPAAAAGSKGRGGRAGQQHAAGGEAGGQQERTGRASHRQQQGAGAAPANSYEALYPSLPSKPPTSKGAKQLNVAARNFEPVPAPAAPRTAGHPVTAAPAAAAQPPLVAPSQQLHPAPAPAAAPQPQPSPAAIAAQQSAVAQQQIASGGAPSFAVLPPPQPLPQPMQFGQGYMQPMTAMQPMQFGGIPAAQLGQMYVAVPYGAPPAMPMSAPPAYMPTALPQMAAPMPAAPIAPVPVKRPLTITPPPEQGAQRGGTATAAASGEGGEGLPQRAGRGGGRRYSSKTGGLTAVL